MRRLGEVCTVAPDDSLLTAFSGARFSNHVAYTTAKYGMSMCVLGHAGMATVGVLPRFSPRARLLATAGGILVHLREGPVGDR